MAPGRDRQIDVLALIDHFVLGGAETLLAQFATVAPKAGIRLSVACLQELDRNPAAAPLRELGIPPVDLDLVGRPRLSWMRILRDHIKRTAPQIVHTHLGTSDVLGGLASRSLRIPMVSTIHTTLWPTRRDTIERQIVRLCASRVIAVSDSAREQYVSRGLASPGQVVTIHNGINRTAQPGAGLAVRRELGLAVDDQVVTMVSALRSEKAHDVAIDAVELLRSRFPKLRLLIVGQGRLQDHLASRAAEMGGSVIVAGMRPDVMRVLDAADICLHPSRHEAFPTTILEAMAASVPVIATAVGGIPEIITNGREGLLIAAPANFDSVARSLSGLLEDPARRRMLGTNGRRAYENRFTADPWVKSTRRLYDEILGERAARRRPFGQRISGSAAGLITHG